MRNLATVLPLKSKLSGKFQRFNAVNGSMEMLINSWISKKFKLKWTILKRSRQWSALRKLFIPPPGKSFLRHWNKNFLTEIYSNIQALAFQELRKCSSLAFRNCAAQMLFSDTNQKRSCWKIGKMSEVFYCVVGVYFSHYWMRWGSLSEWGFLSKTVL